MRIRPLRTENAFTLVELLVTIVVLGILMGVAAPSFLGQQDKAHDSSAQQTVVNASRFLETEWTDEGRLPDIATLRGRMGASEPQYSFKLYDQASASSWSDGPNNVSLVGHDTDPDNIAALCAQSRSGTTFCMRWDGKGQLTASAPVADQGLLAKLAEPIAGAPAYAFENSARIAYARGATQPDAVAALANRDRAGNNGPSNSGRAGWDANTPVAPNPPAVPTNTTAPAITGTAKQGQVLTVSNGVWQHTTSVTRQWKRCYTIGQACFTIPGATGTTYTATADDVGNTLRVTETATGPGGVTNVDSAHSPMVATAAVNYAATRTADNPVAACRFGETGPSYVPFTCLGGAGQYQDTSPRFTLGIPGAIAGDADTALALNGQTHYTYGNSTQTSTQYSAWTVEVWGKYTGGSGIRTFISAQDNWALQVTDSGFRFGMRTGNPWGLQTVDSTGITPQSNRWYHLAGVYDNGTMRLYVNGQQVGSRTGVPVGTYNQGNWSWGFVNGGWMSGGYLQGALDEFAFYRSALSQTRLNAHYTAGCGC